MQGIMEFPKHFLRVRLMVENVAYVIFEAKVAGEKDSLGAFRG